jgi:hypothetical protein
MKASAERSEETPQRDKVNRCERCTEIKGGIGEVIELVQALGEQLGHWNWDRTGGVHSQEQLISGAMMMIEGALNALREEAPGDKQTSKPRGAVS